ncbi:MAG: YXWGXW repeat-containing protein [Acidobacteriota bacterium]|nr:YXWGXW repeat-containing protein [Acidobacteriota bacterium]
MALLLGSAVSSFAGIHIGVFIAAPPPLPPVVAYAAPVATPGSGYIWINGYYYYGGGGYVWRPGYWARPPYARAYWVPPRYHRGRYHEGRWRHR